MRRYSVEICDMKTGEETTQQMGLADVLAAVRSMKEGDGIVINRTEDY